MTKPYFQPLQIGSETIDLSHLEPFSIELESTLARKTLILHVTFSNHCFSRQFEAENHPKGWPVLDAGTAKPRTFCPVRYRLSKQLPDIMRGLTHPKCKVAQTAAVRNWAFMTVIEDPAGPYYVFFEVSRAVQKGRQKQDLSIVVESAYPKDEDRDEPALRGYMSFVVLCGKTYTKQPAAGRSKR